MHADATYVNGAFRAGASGYVLKRCASMELLNAVHEVLKRRIHITPLIAKDISDEKMNYHVGRVRQGTPPAN
jgi:DNA-binding NarL/FixJ family response regulator